MGLIVDGHIVALSQDEWVLDGAWLFTYKSKQTNKQKIGKYGPCKPVQVFIFKTSQEDIFFAKTYVSFTSKDRRSEENFKFKKCWCPQAKNGQN